MLTTKPRNSLECMDHFYVQDCTQLQILRFLVNLPREIAAATIFFALNDFPLLFLSHLQDGASEFNKFCENGVKSGPQRFFVTFLFFSLTRRALLNSTNSAKFAKNLGRNHLSHFTIFCHFFVLTYQRGLLNSFNSPKSTKNRSVSPLYYFSLRLHHLAEWPM